MTYQYINLGTAPSGAGGDTFRSTGTKLNENFTNSTHAASRYVGEESGNLLQTGAFGLGAFQSEISNPFKNLPTAELRKTRFISFKDVPDVSSGSGSAISLPTLSAYTNNYLIGTNNGDLYHGVSTSVQVDPSVRGVRYGKILSGNNTTIDSNGFVKAASPIVQLFADKISANDEAIEQNPIFEKVDIGHYLIKNTLGFAKEGWWIEVPTDTNGNRICAVEYQTLENGDLEIKSFKKKLNEEGDIVANLDAPMDIPNNANGEPRWIDVRLHSNAKPVVIKVQRTEKQPRMVQQVKYAPQLTYITKYEDLFDDDGNTVIVEGQKYQKSVTHIQTDKNGTPILSNQPVINDKGEPVFEWVQAVDSEGQPIFDNVPVLNEDGNQSYDEVTYEPQQ
ncbi:hypothetical protein [Acinetobacter sp. TAC-1]|uniref:phage tail fiber protein n=1 Tax=Acinetobacter sp. TAC-1 TaxID=3027470 RepID=UPI0023AAFB28|nr:hypothetical protein [Acinetobacter sp. TAC-1]WEE38330.1 hypothetical protein PYV58_15450 [Acinetobacter sp. TAC-1]